MAGKNRTRPRLTRSDPAWRKSSFDRGVILLIPKPSYNNVCSFDSLLAAFRKARRAKRGKGDEPAFYLDLESNLLNLSSRLENRTFVPDPYRYFCLYNKKDRVVSVASFRDRVVHHALVAELEPTYEQLFIPTSFACRKGKGIHLALRRAQKTSRKYRYFLKLDIRKYFDHVSHPILIETLGRNVVDKDILWLSATLLSNARVPGVDPMECRGVPIGNLTSQFWANVYLDRLDQEVTTTYGSLPYFRYMDDMLFFGDSKTVLWSVRDFVDSFVRSNLMLDLKDEVTMVAPVSEGIPWLGFRVFAGFIRLDHEAKTRFIRKMRANQVFMEKAETVNDDDRVCASAASLCGHVGHCDSLGFRKSVLQC